MSKSSLTGTRIRARRNLRGLRQSDLAQMVGVSPSYMNLIEHNRRKVSAPLLQAVAQALGVSEDALVQDGDIRFVEGARAAALRTDANLADLERVDEFAGRFPGWAKVLADTQARVERLERVVEHLSDRMTHDPYLGAALHEIISAVTSVQSTAAILNDSDDIAPEWQARFHENILNDSKRLAEGAVALVNYLDTADDTESGLAAPQEEVEAWLARMGFHYPALETMPLADLSRLVEGQVELSSDASRVLALQWLVRLQEDTRALPLDPFVDAMMELGAAPDQLAQHFGVPLPQVLRRLAMLPADDDRLTAHAMPGLVVCDGSGTLVLRRAVDGFPMPRFGGGCPLWPLYQALHCPGRPLRVTLLTDGRMGRRFTAYAICAPEMAPGFDIPPVMQSTMLVVPDSGPTNLPAGQQPLVVGGSCRTCAQQDCPARREPSILVTFA
ncbi:helix-turn-helix transcriptional regulator [Roseinatronobacter alkalisoli]|uniref:Helix-turn-helix domain-containing protein n=1 Tax=Roseinatronobacter alkalisoli TaxID=3028235 RepID=A0ABT5T4P1_9RHOB|nr:helix-turn-helix transcriptional regulator [Roseinatronobacter sp. HJB301]MDD7970087.1 helix-turn-helix domain-containing protein [Roseinatronobacter sp. HJB301]